MVGIAFWKNEIPKTQGVEWDKYVKYAVIIGTPIALGIGYLVYRNRQSTAAQAASKTGSSVKKELTPLEKSQSAKLRGNKFFKGQQFDKAIECYTEAIKLCPKGQTTDLSTFYQNRAAAHEQLKNYAEVVNDCTQALVYNKRYVKALNRRAKACEVLGDLNQSLEDMTAVCILESFTNQSSLLTADRILKAVGAKEAKEAYQNRKPYLPSRHFIKTYFGSFAHDPIMNNLNDPDVVPEEEITEHVVEQTTEESQKDLTEPKNWSKDSPFILVKKALRRKVYDDIIQMCTEEIEAEGSFLIEALLTRASFHLLCGDWENAGGDISRLLERTDVDVRYRSNALIKRACMHLQNGRHEQALDDFNLACETDPENSDVYHHRGQLKLLLDSADGAVKDFDQSINLNPDFGLAQVQKCFAEFRLATMNKSPMMLQAAMESFERTVNKFSDCSEGHSLYAQALADQQLYEQADQQFKKVMEIDPENPNNYVHRGLLHIQWKNDMETGIKLIKQAMNIDAKCEFAYETLATFEVQKGNLLRAKELFDEAIKLAKTEDEMAHLFALRSASIAQHEVSKNLGVGLPATTPY